MDISVIVATYERSEILTKTLESFCGLICEKLKWELIIVDNADDQATRNVVNDYERRLPIIFLTENKKGKNNALNTALPHASGSLYVFTDDDVIADHQWLQEIWKGALRWPNHNMFGGRILPAWPGGEKPNIIHENDVFFGGAYSIADWSIPEGCYTARNVYGPNMTVRSQLFKPGIKFNPKIGPEAGKQYVMGSETEFLLRMEREGNNAVWLPNALVYHQIREDQLTRKWLTSRAYKNGKSNAVLNTDVSNCTLIWGIPKYLFRQVVEFYLEYLWATISGSERRKVQKGIKFWYIWGKTHQLIIERFNTV
ncbi:MAG: glycosyltransferase [Desulfobacterium sp.]|nr:glycosyltransferase [Desulfobacterium sp.]